MIELEENLRILNELNIKLNHVKDSMKINELIQELRKLEEESTKDDFWNDQANSSKVFARIKSIQRKINGYENIVSELNNLKEMNELLNLEPDQDLLKELLKNSDTLKNKLDDLEIQTLFSGKIHFFPSFLACIYSAYTFADQRPHQSRLGKTDVRIRRILILQNGFCPFFRCDCPGNINVFRPLEGSGHQGNILVHHAEHPADTGGIAHLSVHTDHRSAHTQGRNAVCVTCQNAQVTVCGTNDQFLRLALEFQPVGCDDLKRKGGHLLSPFHFSTTSSMVPV